MKKNTNVQINFEVLPDNYKAYSKWIDGALNELAGIIDMTRDSLVIDESEKDYKKMLDDVRKKYREQQMQKYIHKKCIEETQSKQRQIIFDLCAKLIELAPDDKIVAYVDDIKKELQKIRG